MHHVHLVLDQQDGLVAARLEPLDQVEDHRHVVDRHAGRRLVEHEHVRLQRHHDRHLELALVAVRQGHGRQCRACPCRLAAAMKRSAASIQSRRLIQRDDDVAAAAGARLHGKPHVLVHREVRETGW